VAAGLAACGGGGEKSATDAPKPAAPLSNFAQRVATALTNPACPGLQEINANAQFTLPCPAKDRNPRARAAFRNFKITGIATYGTGGVIDFTDAEAPRGATYVTTLGPGRRWIIVAAPIFNRPTAGTRLSGEAGYRRALDNFLRAVRRNDCNGFYRWLATPPALSKAQACKEGLASYAPLRDQLKSHPNAKPFKLGGNTEFVYYGLWTGKQYRTLPVAKTQQPPATVPHLVVTSSRI
jgi:hypothetical protein